MGKISTEDENDKIIPIIQPPTPDSNDDVIQYIQTEIKKQQIPTESDIEMAENGEKLAKGANVDIHDDLKQLERNIHEHSEKFDNRTDKSFAWLQVCNNKIIELTNHLHGYKYVLIRRNQVMIK